MIHGDGGALVHGQQNDIGIERVDPDGVIIVAARRAFNRRKVLPRIRRSIGGGVGNVDDVGIARVDPHTGEIRASPVYPVFVIDPLPGGSGIVGPVHAAGVAPGFHQRVHAVPVRRRNADADAAQPLVETRQPAGELLPGVAAIGGAKQAAAQPRKRPVLPRPLPRLPQHGVNNGGAARIESQIHRAGVLILIEDPLEVVAAIGRSVHAALRVGPVRVAQNGYEQTLRIVRIDDDVGDLLAVAQPQVPPRLAGVV